MCEKFLIFAKNGNIKTFYEYGKITRLSNQEIQLSF